MPFEFQFRPVFKRFILFVIPLIMFSALVFGAFVYNESRTELRLLKTNEVQIVGLLTELLQNDLNSVINDLRYLASYTYRKNPFADISPVSIDELENAYRLFGHNKDDYDQVRLLDGDGREMLRIERRGKGIVVIPEAELQDKSGRYYFQHTMKLKPGDIYVSPFDLNVERGRVETPFKPMIRFGTPIAEPDGENSGMLILNYLGQELLDNFADLKNHSQGSLMLMNLDGYWLEHPNQNMEWGFMFKERKHHHLPSLRPDSWQKLISRASGQFEADEGLYTFATVYPLKRPIHTSSASLDPDENGPHKTPEYAWKVVSHIDGDVLMSQVWGFLYTWLPQYSLLLLVMSVVAWVLALVAYRRKQVEDEREKLIIELTQMQEKLKRLAILDGLTGIPNRRHFDESLNKEWQRHLRNNKALSLIMLDVDNFKLFNDTYGHQAGDDCLRKVARVLEKSVHRPADLAARYGGEEFTLLLPETGREGAIHVAESIRAAVQALGMEHKSSPTCPVVTVSLGVAGTGASKVNSPEALVEMADQAMYQAKSRGRNQVALGGDI